MKGIEPERNTDRKPSERISEAWYRGSSVRSDRSIVGYGQE
jgi:hypothetical protein